MDPACGDEIQPAQLPRMDGAARSWRLWLDKDGDLSFDPSKDSLVSRDSLSAGIRFGLGFPPPSTISVLGSTVPPSGFGAVSTGAIEDCVQGTAFPASPLVTGTWASGAANGLVVGCGGTTADIGNGVLYLSTADYDDKAYAIVFNHVTVGVEAFAVRRYKWTRGGTWVLQ